jgi:hypothetical protein
VDLSGDEGDPGWAGENFVRIPGDIHYRFVTPPGIIAEGWKTVQADWLNAVAAYEARPCDFHSAWNYIDQHPAFWTFTPGGHNRPATHYYRLTTGYGRSCLDIDVGHVRDGTTEVWLETGCQSLHPDEHGFTKRHDPRLDSGGLTFEKAITALARKIHGLYGNDRRFADEEESRFSGGASGGEPGQGDGVSGGVDRGSVPGKPGG